VQAKSISVQNKEASCEQNIFNCVYLNARHKMIFRKKKKVNFYFILND